MGIWKNAFKIPGKMPLTKQDRDFIIKACELIKKKQLSHLAAMAADATLPVHNLTSQAVIFGMPFLNIIFSKDDVQRFADLLQNPAAMDFFKENI